MQAQETILFVAVAALASALIIVLVAPRLRGPRAPERLAKRPLKGGGHLARRLTSGQAGHEAPESRRQVATGAAVIATPPPPPVHMICPTCRRQFAAGLRYCPYDARVLTADLHQPGRSLVPQAASLANAGKICPSCARRYETVALVCGRDGTALVSVN